MVRYVRRFQTETPDALAFAFRDPGGPWTIAARCPYCCQNHLYSAGCALEPQFPSEARCGGRSYFLVPLDLATPIERANTG
ncbi:hypothetical protein [Streptomyces sp. gCLA4]|uniref:hypothetical protein n=1 Tax=Streptomyces sp. gCLA4 TaxID=1873416 RepID=UPI0016037C16|nr:hypothetical protein [Streptomyces sp. gCLA4]